MPGGVQFIHCQREPGRSKRQPLACVGAGQFGNHELRALIERVPSRDQITVVDMDGDELQNSERSTEEHRLRWGIGERNKLSCGPLTISNLTMG